MFDGASALAMAKAVGVAAAIIDMGLPDSNGDHVARELRARYPRLPILICTGYDTAALETATKDIGVRRDAIGSRTSPSPVLVPASPPGVVCLGEVSGDASAAWP